MFKTEILRGTDEFSRYADQWDFLVSQCLDAPPYCQSKNLLSACKRLFENGELIVVFVFDQNGEPVAAMPLIKRWRLGMVVLELPNNEWGSWGELLVNAAYDSDGVYDCIVDALNQISHFGMRLNLINSESEPWRRFAKRLEAHGRGVVCRPAFFVGMIEHDANWSGFRDRLSKGFRKKLSKFKRIAMQQGTITLEVNRQFESGEIPEVMRRVFDIEQRSWKRAAATSIVESDLADFFCEQAHYLAEQGTLCISFLRLNDSDIAFEFGVIVHRRYYSCKISFDQTYQDSSPGHLLAEQLTRWFHLQNECDLQDTIGPISEATARWSSSVKRVSNLIVSGTVPGSKLILKSTFAAKQWLQRSRPISEIPKLGARPVCQIRDSQETHES